MKIINLVLIVVLIVFVIVIYSISTQKAEVKLVEADEFERLMKQEGVFVLNVHTPYEGELNGTREFIEDWENIELHQEQLPEDKNTPILIYCRSGRMSASASQQLVRLEYKNVYDLNGGMNAWKSSGREIIFTRDVSGEK